MRLRLVVTVSHDIRSKIDCAKDSVANVGVDGGGARDNDQRVASGEADRLVESQVERRETDREGIGRRPLREGGNR